MKTSSQFVKQPGDEAATAKPRQRIPIPCILNESVNAQVEWEEYQYGQIQTISENRSIFPDFHQHYKFISDISLDYSIEMMPHNETQVRCYFFNMDKKLNPSSWSNISYAGIVNMVMSQLK